MNDIFSASTPIQRMGSERKVANETDPHVTDTQKKINDRKTMEARKKALAFTSPIQNLQEEFDEIESAMPTTDQNFEAFATQKFEVILNKIEYVETKIDTFCN